MSFPPTLGLLAVLLGLTFPSLAAEPAVTAAGPAAELKSLGKCLGTLDNSAVDGAKAAISTCSGASSQSWQLPPRGFSGPIVGPGGKCLDVNGANPADLTPVILFTCHGLPHQIWRHELDGRIVGLADKCLDVFESGTANGTPVVLFHCGPTANQLWSAGQRNYFQNEPLLSESRLAVLAASPALPDRIFAAAGSSGILRSENAGLDWAGANQGVHLGLGVSEVAVDPLRPDFVYALQNGRLLRSQDGGRHFFANAGAPANLRSLALDPRLSGHLLALDGTRIYESLDHGQYFSERAFPTQQSPGTLLELIFDPLVSDRLWIAAAATCAFCTGPDQGVFRSDNGGASWTRVFVLPTRRVVADPHAAGQVYALVDDQLYRSTNAGTTWQLLANFAAPLLDLWVDSTFAGRLVVSHTQGMARSSDGGTSFLPVAAGLRPGEFAWRFLHIGGRLLVTTDAFDGHPGQGVLASTDFGASWTLRNQRGFATGQVKDIESTPGGRLWVATHEGIYASADHGVTYSRKLATTGPAGAGAVLVDPFDATGNTLYAAASREPGAAGPFLWRSANGGNSWQSVAGADGQAIATGGFVAVASAGKRIYLTTFRGLLGGTSYRGILSSDNDGGLWKPLDLGVSVRLLEYVPTDQAIYAAGDALLRSFDGGKTWQQVQAIHADAMTHFGDTLYLAEEGQLHRVSGQGSQRTTIALPPAIRFPSALLATADRLYLGDFFGSLHASADRGGSWTALDLGLPTVAVTALKLDPLDGSLLAGTAGAGLHRTVAASDQAPLRFAGDRFTATITWKDFLGASGSGRAAAWTEDSGFFWFFQPENVEVMVKVLDGQTYNGNYWVFVGSLSNVEFHLTVRDEWTGRERIYHNPLGSFASFGDTDAFPGQPEGGLVIPQPAAMAPKVETAGRAISGTPSVLIAGRFEISVEWSDGVGQDGPGFGRLMTGDTAAFNFFSDTNTELVIKVLDGRTINGHYWVFYGALSNVAYQIRIRDLETGQLVIYDNPLGNFASVGDITAF